MKKTISQNPHTLFIATLMFVGYALADRLAVILKYTNQSVFSTVSITYHIILLMLACAVISAIRLIIRLAVSILVKKQTLKVKVVTIHLCLAAGLMKSVIESYIYFRFGYIKSWLIILLQFLFGCSFFFYLNDLFALIRSLQKKDR